jgi:thiamine kinase-like enzyme
MPRNRNETREVTGMGQLEPAGRIDAIAARFAGSPGQPHRITALAGPWGHNGVFLVDGPGKRFVLKQWREEDRIRRGRAEVVQLIRLTQHGFRAAPRPLPVGADWSLTADDGTLWTAQEYIEANRSVHPAASRGAMASRIGAVLADLHVRTEPLHAGPPARIRELADLDLSTVPGEFRSTVATARQVVLDERERLATLPHGCLHGDVNFDNMILGERGLVLIDWEFTRRDLRILDLATLRAPIRTTSGRFVTVPPGRFAAMVRDYQRVADPPLSPLELELLPTAALMHYLLVVRDTIARASRHVGAAVAVARRLLRDVVAHRARREGLCVPG